MEDKTNKQIVKLKEFTDDEINSFLENETQKINNVENLTFHARLLNELKKQMNDKLEFIYFLGNADEKAVDLNGNFKKLESDLLEWSKSDAGLTDKMIEECPVLRHSIDFEVKRGRNIYANKKLIEYIAERLIKFFVFERKEDALVVGYSIDKLIKEWGMSKYKDTVKNVLNKLKAGAVDKTKKQVHKELKIKLNLN